MAFNRSNLVIVNQTQGPGTGNYWLYWDRDGDEDNDAKNTTAYTTTTAAAVFNDRTASNEMNNERLNAKSLFRIGDVIEIVRFSTTTSTQAPTGRDKFLVSSITDGTGAVTLVAG